MAKVKIHSDLIRPLNDALAEAEWLEDDGYDVDHVEITLYERGSGPTTKFRVQPVLKPIIGEVKDKS